MTFAQALEDIRHRPIEEFYQFERSLHGGLYCCPICGSGHGDDKTGALKIYQNPSRVICFSGKCFGEKGEDTPGALSKIWGCNLREVLKRAGYQLDNQTDNRSSSRSKTQKPNPKPRPEWEDYTEQFNQWHSFLLQDRTALDYLHNRGINDEAIEHFNLGYAPEFSLKDKPKWKSKRIIFPRSKHGYSARKIENDNGASKYLLDGDPKALFNWEAATELADKQNMEAMPVFVVEGEADAIAIWQSGFERVIGLNSTNGKNVFLERAKKADPTTVYILALDNDPDGSIKDGQKTQAEIARGLEAAQIAYISADTAKLFDGKKDPSEAALADPNAFADRLVEYAQQGAILRGKRQKAAELEAYNRSGAGMVDSFLQAVQDHRYEPISSGIKSLDYATGGGFIRESVVMLGAAPGMGKTALVSQICENIATTGGADILYINLEMSRDLLLARSIARIANRQSGKITVNEILRGYEWSAETRQNIENAAEQYKREIAEHLIYNPGEHTTNLDEIIKKIEAEKHRIGHAPIVCLDYLQLLTGRPDEDTIDVIKRAMQSFKQYANDNHTVVFIVTANNRDSMKTGESGLNSGRDSSNIEYGADLHMGLEYEKVGSTFKGITEKDGKLDANIESGKQLSFIGAIKKAYHKMLRRNERTPRAEWNEEDEKLEELYNTYCTRYVVRVNKNRYGDSEKTATLIFDGATAQFVELDTVHEEPRNVPKKITSSQLPF